MLRRLFAAAAVLAASALAAPSLAAQPIVPARAGELFDGRVRDGIAARGAAAQAAALPAGFSLETVASGLAVPVATAFLPDGRLLVVEKEGRLKLVAGGQTRLVLDLTAEVLEHGDRGLLGVAVDPRFAQTGWIYLVYTVARDGAERPRTDAFGRLTRYTLDAAGAAVPGSRRVLIGETFAGGIPACYYSHTVGTLAFGRDGSLFVGTGDAASYNTVDAGGLYPDCFGPDGFPAAEDVGAFRSQRLSSLAGKILRVDPATGRGYPSNPFYTGNPDDAASKVWALGFRNPFRFSVDPATGSTDPAAGDPGTVYYGDVGYVTWEEVGVVRRGQNMGWPCREGPGVQTGGGSYPSSTLGRQICPSLAATAPAFAWHHTDAALSVPAGRAGRSVVGGAVYRGTRYPAEYRGRLFYADYAQGWLASARVASGGALADDALFAPDAGPVVDVAYDASTQHLFLTNVYAGTVQRLRYAGDGNTPPVAVAGAAPAQGAAPLVVRFTGSGSTDVDGDALRYAWTFGTGETSTAADPTATYTAPGDYTARLTVTDARGASSVATAAVTVRAGSPPSVRITQPAEGQTVLSGQTLAFAGAGTDPDPGQTAGLTYAWSVTLVHETHQHPGAFTATGPTAAYTVPFHGDAGERYALLVRLTATDASGFSVATERTVAIGGAAGETDVTSGGTPVALVTAPTGGGARALATIADGVAPAPVAALTDALAALQYDTYTGGGDRAVDWIGYTFAGPRPFSRVRLTEGGQFPDGGWFETLGVEVRTGGAWRAVTGLSVTPAYRGADGQHFDTVDLAFAPVEGDGVRIIGRPGGASRFVSVAELRVFSPASAVLGPLPAPWLTADIDPYAPGAAGAAGGTFTVRGGGDVWGDADHFRYVWQPLAGDGTLTVRIAGLAAANPWAKAGLMVRASTAPDAPHAMLVATPGHGTHLQFRRAAGSPTEWQPGPARTVPTWLRLTRVGAAVSAYTSADGQTWALVGSAPVALGQTALVGLMATSTDFSGRGDVATATFTDVALAPAGGPPDDVTAQGTPTALVTAPTGGGSRTLATIRDGVAPAPTTDFPADLAVHYDTYTGGGARALDWIGYTFAAPLTLARVRLTEGAHLDDGGWFETLGVEVRTGGAWRPVTGLSVAPAYPAANDGRHFDAYDLTFAPVSADGVRVVGRPGGTARFVSVAELRVFGQAAATGALPEGWTSADVGTVGAAGTAAYADGVFTVRGNGDLWGDADHAHLASTALAGDGTLTARLDAVAGENPWAKAGLMIRASAAPDAPHVMLVGTPGRGVHLQYRTARGGETGWQAGADDVRAPVWLRLVRAGAVVSGYVSPDGVAFALVGRTTVPLPADVLAGLVAASTDYTGRGDLATARFSSVALGTAGSLDAPAAPLSRTTAATPFAIESLFPNPARTAATLRIGIPEAGLYRAEILDVLGRRVAEHTLREDAPGEREVRLDLSGQSAGLYVVRVTRESGETLTRRLTVVR